METKYTPTITKRIQQSWSSQSQCQKLNVKGHGLRREEVYIYLSLQSNIQFPLNTTVGKLTTLDGEVNPLIGPSPLPLTPLMPLPNSSPLYHSESHTSIRTIPPNHHLPSAKQTPTYANTIPIHIWPKRPNHCSNLLILYLFWRPFSLQSLLLIFFVLPNKLVSKYDSFNNMLQQRGSIPLDIHFFTMIFILPILCYIFYFPQYPSIVAYIYVHHHYNCQGNRREGLLTSPTHYTTPYTTITFRTIYSFILAHLCSSINYTRHSIEQQSTTTLCYQLPPSPHTF